MNTKTILATLILCGGLGWAFALPGYAESPTADLQPSTTLTVELVSGRRFTAELDVRTDQDQLWLRFSATGGFLLRPIAWDRVVAVELAGETYRGHELREAVALLREKHPRSEGLPGGERGVILTGYSVPPLLPPPPLPPPPLYVAAHRFEPPRVRSLAIEVCAANWDNDAVADGLLLTIYPLDGAGFIVPVRGTIQVELIGEEAGPNRSAQPLAVLDRWTEQVCPVDFYAPGARYKLPFRRTDREFARRWASQGLVHVRLAVPGEGLFEASQDTRIRPYSALRDRWDLTRTR